MNPKNRWIRLAPYLQYFIGLPGYQDEPPSDSSSGGAATVCDEKSRPEGNKGTLIVDASCAPVNIRYPQDISLLNEAREKLEVIIYRFCQSYGLTLPRRYVRKARKDYLAYAKARKHTKKQTRKAIKKQLSYVRRDLAYLDGFMCEGYAPLKKEIPLLLTIMELYRQQQYMYDHKTHSVKDRTVSIHQPWIRPIVRGKAKAPIEFGAKLDLSIDEKGYSRIEHISFDAYNESAYLQDAACRYYERTGHYPERILVDQIYRTRENRAFCKKHEIRMSGPKLTISGFYGSYPCHRVVNHMGRLAPHFREQHERLRNEGIEFKENGCVDMKKYQWEC